LQSHLIQVQGYQSKWNYFINCPYTYLYVQVSGGKGLKHACMTSFIDDPVTLLQFLFQNCMKSPSLRGLRLEGQRRALVWQKKYLLLLINQIENADSSPKHDNISGKSKLKKFRYVRLCFVNQLPKFYMKTIA